MYLKWNRFKSYCIDHGIHLLKDDFKFIEKVLKNIPANEHRTILKSYTDAWIKVMTDNKKSPRAQNLGRLEANKELLKQIKTEYN